MSDRLTSFLEAVDQVERVVGQPTARGLALLLLGVSALAVVLAGLVVYHLHARLTEIRDVLVELRDEFR